MVMDEHACQSFPPEWWESAFRDAIALIGPTCLTTTPWGAPVVITRCWCLWEMYCTVACGATLTICLAPAEESAVIKPLAEYGGNAVLQPFAALDSRKAEATRMTV